MSKADTPEGQSSLGDFTAGTTTETVVRTIVCELETSKRKNETLRTAIEEWQEIASYFATVLPSFPKHRWGRTNDTHLYRVLVREFDDLAISKACAFEAAKKVTEAFDSWNSRGCPGERPRFGEGSYARLRTDQITIEENDRGFGVKLSLIPYNPLWFHLRIGGYQREFLEAVVAGEAKTGSAEVHLRDDGSASIHLTVKTDVEVYKPDEVSRWVGVDLGEKVLYAAAAVDGDGNVSGVDVESGREFRHYRERLKRKRKELQEKDNLRGLKKCRDEHDRYTEYILGVASRRIVDLASEHAPCGIRIEKLTHYRENAHDPIHDWPYAALQEKICYKATAAGIPVEFVEPAGTSSTCRKCGQNTPESRNGIEFKCRRCGYEVHADVNAAINIARG